MKQKISLAAVAALVFSAVGVVVNKVFKNRKAAGSGANTDDTTKGA